MGNIFSHCANPRKRAIFWNRDKSDKLNSPQKEQNVALSLLKQRRKTSRDFLGSDLFQRLNLYQLSVPIHCERSVNEFKTNITILFE